MFQHSPCRRYGGCYNIKRRLAESIPIRMKRFSGCSKKELFDFSIGLCEKFFPMAPAVSSGVGRLVPPEPGQPFCCTTKGLDKKRAGGTFGTGSPGPPPHHRQRVFPLWNPPELSLRGTKGVSIIRNFRNVTMFSQASDEKALLLNRGTP